MKKLESGHYEYTIEELEKLQLTPHQERLLFGASLSEIKKHRKTLVTWHRVGDIFDNQNSA